MPKEIDQSSEKPHYQYSAHEFTDLFVYFCREKCYQIFDVIIPPEERIEADDGSITTKAPPVRLAEYGSTDSRKAFVRGPQGDYTVWEFQSELSAHQANIFLDPEIEKVKYNAVDIYKIKLPEELTPKALNGLRSVAPGLNYHLQYRYEKEATSGRYLSSSLDLFQYRGQGDTLLYDFITTLNT